MDEASKPDAYPGQPFERIRSPIETEIYARIQNDVIVDRIRDACVQGLLSFLVPLGAQTRSVFQIDVEFVEEDAIDGGRILPTGDVRSITAVALPRYCRL